MSAEARNRRALLKPLALVGVVAVLAAAALLVSVPRGHGAHVSPAVVFTVPVGDFPTGVGVNPSTDRVYGANAFDDTVSVIDGATNAVVATVAVGDFPQDIGVNPSTDLVYVSNRNDNTVSVIDGATNAVVATVAVGGSPTGVGVNPSTDLVYVANHFSDTVSVIDGATNAVVATVAAGDGPFAVRVNPSTDLVYVANAFDDTVSVIDGATNAVVATVPVGDVPFGVGVNPNTNSVYVANAFDATVSVIDGVTNAVVATVPVGVAPLGVGVNPSADRVYVANRGNDNVSVIACPDSDCDGDGIADAIDGAFQPGDNCPLVANSIQADTDADAIGDACDPTPSTKHLDPDGDGINNWRDTCPLTVNLNLPGPGVDFDFIDSACDPAPNINDGPDLDLDGVLNFFSFTDASTVASFSFDDRQLGGSTFGTIVSTNGLTITVTDLPNPLGVTIAATGTGGPASISLCGGTVTLTLFTGSQISATCTSVTITVISGPVSAQFGTISADLAAGTTVTITDLGGGAFEVSNSNTSTSFISVAGLSIFPGVTVTVQAVDIDIKPGSDPNSINAASQGLIPVAILSTASFEATTMDGTSVRFGPAAASPVHDQTDSVALANHQADVDGDGLTDYVLHFRMGETGISEGDTEACLTGQTFGGIAIQGCDDVPSVGGTPTPTPIGRGGIVGLLGDDESPADASGSSARDYTAPIVAAASVAAVLTLTAGGWYARRRWLR